MFQPTPQMIPFFQQMMQQQGAGGSGMPMWLPNAAPQVNVPNARAPQNSGVPPMLPPQQQLQQPGFMQNMMSSPTQMTNGMNLMNKGSSWLDKQFTPSGPMGPDGMPMAGGASGNINWGPYGGVGGAASVPESMVGKVMPAAGSMGGVGAATGLDAVGAAAPIAPIAAAPVASALAPAAGAARTARAAGAGFSLADLLPFLFA